MISSSGYGMSGFDIFNGHNSPYVQILEQPASKALRFRYECEGRSAGSIPGANSSTDFKTYPTIKICNYRGRGIVVVSCVTKDQPYRPHPHSLVGKGTCTSGVCRMEITPGDSVLTFANLGIQCVKKKDIAAALCIREGIRVDPFGTGFEHKSQPSSVDLNAIRLCFQVFLEGREGKINIALRPVVSEPIYDKKAMSDLMICRLSHYSASVSGEMEMMVLCEKVTKDNIQVRFFEKRDGCEVWEGYGEFKAAHVHKQVAITFRTPCYRYRQIDEPIQVYIQLRRPSDGVKSEPLPFKFLPLGADDQQNLKRKRRRFEDSPRAHVLRRIQVETENESSSVSESQSQASSDPLNNESQVQSFPLGGIHDEFNECASIHSPARPHIDGPVLGDQHSLYVAYKEPHIAIPGQQHLQQHMGMQQLEYPQFSSCCMQQQSHQEQGPILQKLTLPQQTLPPDVNQQDLEGAVGGSDLMDTAGPQRSSFNSSLNELDSADLVAFGDAFLQSFVEAMPAGARGEMPWCHV